MQSLDYLFLDDVPSLVAHFVYNVRLRFELMAINLPPTVFNEVKLKIQQACTSAEVCAFKLHLLRGPDCDIDRAWASLKQRALSVFSDGSVGNEERAALYIQIEELCGRFGTALSENVSGRLRNLLAFGQNIKAVIGITDNMVMLEGNAAEIYMRTTSELPHDSFTPEFMGVTEQLRGCMREVIAAPLQDSPDETIELVHTLAVWQAEHFLSHFNPEAFNMSDVLGVLRSDGVGSVPEDVLERYSDSGRQVTCHRGSSDASDSSSGEEKIDISEKKSEEKNDDLKSKSTDDQFDLAQMIMQPLQTSVGLGTHMAQAADDREAVSCTESSTTVAASLTVTNQQSIAQPLDRGNNTSDDMPSGSEGGLLKGQSDRVAIVKPSIHCDGVVDGLSLEEWEELVLSVDTTDKELTSTVQERLSMAIHDQVTVVTRLQDDLTQLKEAFPSHSSGIIREALDTACRDKQRKFCVAETWIQQLDFLQQAVKQMLGKAKLKTIRGLDSLVLKDAIKQTLDEYSDGSMDYVRQLVSAVSDLIQQVDISSDLKH